MSSTTNLEAAVLYGKWQNQLAVPQLIAELKNRREKDDKLKNQRYHVDKESVRFICNGREIALSPRETDCLIRLIVGKTNKIIGAEIGLSHRTVEYYIDNLKAKMGCSKKKDILDAINHSDFFKKFASPILAEEVD